MAFFIAFINLSLGFAKYEKGKFSVPRELNETFDSLCWPIMLNNLKLEKVWINQEYFSNSCKKTRQRKNFSHTVQFEAAARNRESNPNDGNEVNSQKFVSTFASISILKILPSNELLGLEADSLEVIPGDCSSTDENDLNKVFFKVTNNPCENQLEFAYYLSPWQKCSIRFSFICEKIIDISTIEKMNIQDRIIF